jgi:hypothetical protein
MRFDENNEVAESSAVILPQSKLPNQHYCQRIVSIITGGQVTNQA